MSPQHRDWEKKLEKHFCHKLDINGKYKLYLDSEISVDKELCLHWEMLEDFLRNTQEEIFNNIKEELGYDWKEDLGKKIREELNKKPLFQFLIDGLKVNTHHLDLAFFKPPTDNNPELLKQYWQNVFSAIRQYHFSSKANVREEVDERQSIDIVICLNGFAIITIELKHTLAGQNVDDAVQQYCVRETTLHIFNSAFVHLAVDDSNAKIATTFSQPPIKEDFKEFNTGLINIKPNENEYAIHYLYDEILLPDNILNFIENYLYGTKDKWIFPRYHQQRCVKKVFDNIVKEYKKNKKLNLRYLIQHSAGSGKSNTIVWLVQNLRTLHIDNVKLFDHIIVLTHRINLDDQISKDFLKAIGQMGVVAYCRNSNDLKLSLGMHVEGYRNPQIPMNAQVVVTILHKFSFLKDLSDQTNKKICFIIDEAHTSQEGKLHEGMVEIFDEATGATIEQKQEDVVDEQEELVEEISLKEFPNLCFIALTATPSDRTLEKFGQKEKDDKWSAFDNYTMDEAIKEGYIMDVAKNIISYETLYELNYQYKSEKEYPLLQVYRALKLKAFEDDEVIEEKCEIIVQIFKDQTAQKIEGKAKAMVVTSSRLSAVKYKLFLNEELKRINPKWKSLVAFSGQINYNNKSYSETEMNKLNNPRSLKIEDCFNQNDDIRFLIVANKFQVGFSESLLHTMFLDKAISGRNAVQTISRLNRLHPPHKVDTLTVDFTNSYDDIIKAFKKYQHGVESHKDANPKDLFKLKDELLKKGIFTLEDIEQTIKLFNSSNPKDTVLITAQMTKIKGILDAKFDMDKKREFRTLLSRYISLFNYIKSLFRIPQKELHDFHIFATLLYRKLDPTMSNEELQREIEKVKLKAFDISKIEVTTDDDSEDSNGSGTERNREGSITYVKKLATVEEIVIAINLRFKERISPEGVQVVEGYIQSLHKEDSLKTTIKNNLNQDERQVYDLVIKSIMNRLYTDYIINKSPEHYTELTEDNIQSFINQSAYRMLREMVRAA